MSFVCGPVMAVNEVELFNVVVVFLFRINEAVPAVNRSVVTGNIFIYIIDN
jgi:hypothetical protein